MQQAPYTADLQWNRVSNLEPSGPKAETLPLGHRGLYVCSHGKKPLTQSPSPNHCTIFVNFYFIWKLVTSRYVINPLRTTVKHAFQLLGASFSDCHNYVPDLVAFSYRLSRRRDTNFSSVRFNKKKCAGPEQSRALGNVGQTEPHVFIATVLKGIMVTAISIFERYRKIKPTILHFREISEDKTHHPPFRRDIGR
ncbi:hypothetical protein AVEN_24396-1 [Araneus ventricosus]|uniref:Uncharacterized protein n=1 Tax=Araneus ventricosus TaxID=182803 RepID=A0A4Y2TQS2_ARAVE|nr:hypothetical protein AVEN_102020-1 [Araneus ventricosus]GBO02995.1 hypothetical protein AVEN_24396-1 [Araneus ventricosus]